MASWRVERAALEPWLHRLPSRAAYLEAAREAQRLQAQADVADAALRKRQAAGGDAGSDGVQEATQATQTAARAALEA